MHGFAHNFVIFDQNNRFKAIRIKTATPISLILHCTQSLTYPKPNLKTLITLSPVLPLNTSRLSWSTNQRESITIHLIRTIPNPILSSSWRTVLNYIAWESSLWKLFCIVGQRDALNLTSTGWIISIVTHGNLKIIRAVFESRTGDLTNSSSITSLSKVGRTLTNNFVFQAHTWYLIILISFLCKVVLQESNNLCIIFLSGVPTNSHKMSHSYRKESCIKIKLEHLRLQLSAGGFTSQNHRLSVSDQECSLKFTILS